MRMSRRTGIYLDGMTFDPVLNNNTWEQIRAASDRGIASTLWSVGDRKAVTLDGTVGNFTFSSVATYAFILGFNHNSTYEGSNRIHFQFAKTALSGGTDVCFIDSKYYTSVSSTGYFSMNSTNTNVGGWSSSQMRSLLGTSLSSYSGKLIGALPSALRSVLKSVTKYTDNTGGGSGSVSGNVTSTTDYMFLLSEYEVSGSISYANTYESSKQAQYSYYSAGNSKIKYKHSDTATAAIWWLRSPSSSSAAFFVSVGKGGSVSGGNAGFSIGVAPGFCV
jgi:hypothetical protein